MPYSPQHLDRLRLRHLRLFELIDQQKSLRAVGNILNLTQPAVSQMVKDLEYAFGITLIDRSARGVTLNKAGKIALQRARSGLASFDHLAEELQSDQTLMLRIGTNSAMLFQILPNALRRLDAGHSGIRFKVHTGVVGDMMQTLLDGALDCYVGRVDWDQVSPDMMSVLRHEPLAHTDLVLACSNAHPLAGRSNLSVRDLAEWPWALPPADSNNRIALESGFRNHGLPGPTPAVEVVADPNALIELTKQLNLLTCVPRLALDAHMAAGELHVLELPDLRLPPIQICFVTLAEHDEMTQLKKLRQALVEATTLV